MYVCPVYVWLCMHVHMFALKHVCMYVYLRMYARRYFNKDTATGMDIDKIMNPKLDILSCPNPRL